MIESVVDQPLDREFEPRREGDVDRSAAEVTNASEKLGFTSNVSLEEGIERTFRWHKKNV
jgi:UDP-glucose 4-epimerase